MLKPGKMGEAQRKVRRANEYLKAGDLDNAAIWFEDALSVDPNSKKALAGLGKIARLKKIQERLSEGLSLLEQERLDEAEKALREVISLEPKNAQAVNGLRQIVQARKPPPPPPPEKPKVVESSPKTRRIQPAQNIEFETETLTEYLARSRAQSRRGNIRSLLISGILHITVFLVLSLFIREISFVSKDEIPIEWVKVQDPKAPSPRSPKIVPDKNILSDPRLPEARTVKSLADRAAKSDLQSPTPSSIAGRRMESQSGPGVVPQMFSAVNSPTSSDEDMMFSSHETMALGSNVGRPGTSDRAGTGDRGRNLGGLSNIESSAAYGGGLSDLDLGGIGGPGLLSPDPMNMVSAVTLGRQGKETVVFLLDVSNSMSGNYLRTVYSSEWFKKLKRAKRSIIASLYKMRPDNDKFYLVGFSSGTQVFQEEPVIVNDENLEAAVKFVEGLTTTSHQQRTNLYSVLTTAFELEPTRIILVSDGLPTEGVVSIKNILKGVREKSGKTRIFTFAINLGGVPEAQVLLSRIADQTSGKFTDDKMGLPRGISVNSVGDIYVADILIKTFTNAGDYIRSFGTHALKMAVGPSDDLGILFYPSAQSSGFGALGVCRSDGTQLKTFATFGYLLRQLFEPYDLDMDSKGRLYVVETRANRVSVFESNGDFVGSFGSAGMRMYETGPHERGDSLSGGSRGGDMARTGVESSEPGYLSRPLGVALDGKDNIYVLDSGNRRIQIFNPRMEYTSHFGISGWGMGIVADNKGDYVYLLTGSGSTGGGKVQIYRPNGDLVREFDVTSGSADIDVDIERNIYVLNFVYDEVNIFNFEGKILRSFSTVE